MTPIEAALLFSTILPALGAGGLLLWLGGGKEPHRTRLQAGTLAAGYAVGSYLLIHRLSFPPHDVSEALTFVALGLVLFVWIAPKEVGARYAMRALFVLLLGALLLWPIRNGLMHYTALRNLLAFYCLALGVWSIVERASRQVEVSTLIALPLLAATAVSLRLLFAASASFSQLVGVLCGQLGACLALALIQPKRVSLGAITPFVSVYVVLFMVAGHFYLDINPWQLIALCIPFAVLWIRSWLPVPKGLWLEPFLLSLLAGAPLGYILVEAYKAAGPLY